MTDCLCKKCGILLTLENWTPSQQKKNNKTCGKCCSIAAEAWRNAKPERRIKARARSKDYYWKNRDKVLAEHKQYTSDNREEYNQYMRDFNKRRRAQVMQYYGSICKCCSEFRDELLTIDHIIPIGGAQKRKEAGHRNIYNFLVKNNFPDGFRILCYNCNFSRARYGYCPHEREKLSTLHLVGTLREVTNGH